MIHFDFIEKKIYTIENNHSRNETEVACFFVHVFFPPLTIWYKFYCYILFS